MDLVSFMKSYADEIGGQFTSYDNIHSIIIVPLAGGRFQSVIGTIKENKLYSRNMVTFTSKICNYNSSLPLKNLLEQSSLFNYGRFIISDDFLQIEAVASMDGTPESSVKEMIQEVANLADQYEFKLTGSDVH
ncbi:MAG: hypothetical protein KDC93_03230 [Cyclobacteriaceae bacterium]|jgi:hypothetical protein|nr:hypothetical protein [Cyclobacteriaceae bacterium]